MTASHGSANIAMQNRVHQLLTKYAGEKAGADLIFTTPSGERVTHVGTELEKLSEHFGKKFQVTPTMARKQIATSVAQAETTEGEVCAVASHMTHSELQKIILKKTSPSASIVEIREYSLERWNLRYPL